MSPHSAVDELNPRGIFWTDAKNSNFDIVEDKTALTGFRVILFDLYGFRLVDPARASARNATPGAIARDLQTYIENLPRGVDVSSPAWFASKTGFFQERFWRVVIE